MNKQTTSSFIFDLIEEYEVFSAAGAINSLTNEAFNSFCIKYKQESISRDANLFNHVKSSPNIFRCHLPYSKWSLSVAFNVVWYYDELILTDPILNLINEPLQDSEQQKYRFQELLRFIIQFRECIEGGYILFAGDHIIPNRTSQFQTESNNLVKDPKVLSSFEKYTLLGQKPSEINSNSADNLQQLIVKYEGMWGETSSMGTYIPPHILNSDKLSNGISYDFTTPYNIMTKDELIGYGKQDMLESLQKEYSKDISVVLESLTNAQRLNTPVLFFRELDSVIAKQYSAGNQNENLIANSSVYDCSIPYLEGIPADRLFEARTQIPEAFREYRAFLYELVNKTMKATDNPAEIKFRIDSKILSMQRMLTAEMKSAKRKWNFQGVATPIVLGLGSLSLHASNIDYPTLVSTLAGAGGLIQSLNTWSDVKSEKQKAEVNPVYFLWKTQQVK